MIGGFGVNCNNTVIIGGGEDSSHKVLKDVFQWTSNQFVPMQPLNFSRYYCSSVYVPLDTEKQDGVLIVTGSYGEGGDTIEYLNIDGSTRSNKWVTCVDKLPCELYGHQMTLHQGKIIISGGMGIEDFSNQIWEGTITIQDKLRVEWKSLAPMLERRIFHVSLITNEHLYCIGGMDLNTTEFYSFKKKTWEKGPDLPFTLDSAQCVHNPITNQHFIIGGLCDGKKSSKIYTWDPKKSLIEVKGEIDIPRNDHIAVKL